MYIEDADVMKGLGNNYGWPGKFANRERL